MIKHFAPLIFMLMTACATTSPAAPAPSETGIKVNELPAQSLAPGECGVFGWSKSAVPEFIFFASETAAKFYQDGAVVNLLPDSADFPAAKYVGDVALGLELGAPEAMMEGARYRSARLRLQTAEGWEKLIPIAALTTCQK